MTTTVIEAGSGKRQYSVVLSGWA